MVSFIPVAAKHKAKVAPDMPVGGVRARIADDGTASSSTPDVPYSRPEVYRQSSVASYLDSLVGQFAQHDDLQRLREEHAHELRVLRDSAYMLSKSIGDAQMRFHRDTAHGWLREWAQKGTEAKVRQEIERKLSYQGSLVVTDMSGFTRITREEGILHFLMLIKQMQSICLPIFMRFGGSVLKVEADDIFVLFPAPDLAVQAALACQTATQAFSATRERANDKIILSLGIVDGPMWLIPHVDAFGDTVELGFRLGEDLADKAQILVHSSVKRKIESMQGAAFGTSASSARDDGFEFDPLPAVEIDGKSHEVWAVRTSATERAEMAEQLKHLFPTPRRRQSRSRRLGAAVGALVRRLCCCRCTGGCSLSAQRRSRRPESSAVGPLELLSAPMKRGSTLSSLTDALGGRSATFGGLMAGVTAAASRTCVLAAEVNQEEPLDLILMLNERMVTSNDSATVSAIDARIAHRFVRRRVTVLVVMLHVSGASSSHELKTVHAILEIKSLAERVVKQYGGGAVKAVQERTMPALFALMPSPIAAVEVVVLLAKLCEHLKLATSLGLSMKLRAGIACGDVLDFDSCNTFGDPVNTAFKLGEDLAAHWEVAVAPEAAEQLPVALMTHAPFQPKTASISALTLTYHSLQMQAPDAISALAKVELLVSGGHGTDPSGVLDWTPLLGRGVRGLQYEYGIEQEGAAATVQASYRGHLQRSARYSAQPAGHVLQTVTRLSRSSGLIGFLNAGEEK